MDVPGNNMTNPIIPQDDFAEISQLIAAARQRAVQAVNTALIDLYWQVGQAISRKIDAAEWATGWLHSWPNIWRVPSLGCVVSRGLIYFACDSFMRLIKGMKLSLHW
jgi:DUF1016 N-terminal domain